MDNDLISRSALLEKAYLTEPASMINPYGGDCVVKVEDIEAAPAVDAVPIEKLGKIGKLFLPYKGCPRGHVGRMGEPYTLEDEALFWGVIEDVDGGRWVPVVEAVLHELIEKAKTTACKWISVEDEKPKRNGWYWCYHLPNSINGNERWETQSLYWEDNMWLYHPRAFKVARKVTHWMPLPQPPREEPDK